MQVEITLEPIDARCPMCEHAFVALPGAPGVVAGCFRCGGAWLDNDAANWVLSHRPTPELSAFASTLAPKSQDHGVTPLEATPGGYRASGQPHVCCPACGEELRDVQITQPAMVVEVCDDHRTSFRGDELRQLTEEASRKIGLDLEALAAEVEAVAEAASREYAGERALSRAEVAQIFAQHYRARSRRA